MGSVGLGIGYGVRATAGGMGVPPGEKGYLGGCLLG